MGADSPPPAPVMHDFPALLASPANHNKPDEEEDKRDYRADDEDEYEDEVDNSFEYEPVVNYTVASEASEAFAGDDVTKEDGVEEQEQVSKERSPQKSPLDEDEEKPSSSLHDTPAVVEKVDVDRHTVIQNTTVVKKYTHDVAASDEVQQHNKHMAVAVSSSSAVINHVKSSTRGLASVNGLGDGSSSFISTDDEEYSTPDLDASVADTVEESRADTARDDFEDEKTSDEEEKTCAIVPISPSTRHDQLPDDAGEAMDVDPDDEVVSETPQSGDTTREADDEKSDAPEQQQQEKMPEADAAPASLPDAGPLPDASAESKKPTTPTPRTKMLGSKSMWKMKKGQVECPQQCFHPESWLLDDTAHVAKAHCLASMDKDTLGFLAPPGDDLHVFDDNESGGAGEEQQEYMLKPGSVAYLPAGAWFEVETQGPNSMWLEIQLVSMPYRDLVFSALNQLAMGDKQWRMGVQLYPGDRNQAKAIRHHAEACVKSLCNDVKGLNGGDLLPEYLCTEDMQDLMALGLLHNVNVSLSSTSFEVDLTNPKFKLKHEKVFKDADYRVNPVAVLMSADEIPHLLPEENEEQSAEDSRPLHHALKKTPKPKRKQALRVIALTGKHTYVLDEMFGNAALESRLHVKFQCSASQSRMIEWLRGRGAEPFNLDEFRRCDVSLHQSKRPTQGEENARLLLRFLCFVGYVTQMKKLPA
ncbi:JmjC domain [Phytophthora cinnamomi]|uniref:JmjC domain n=1 Tax=Phytophthora cinnamomi TaxID=4785 RepID=UPI00355AB19A|nr:JmjC domain [Phytophthora cinnamomi]